MPHTLRKGLVLAVKPEAVARDDAREAVGVSANQLVRCGAPFVAGDGDAGLEVRRDVDVEVTADVGEDGGCRIVGDEDLGGVGEDGGDGGEGGAFCKGEVQRSVMISLPVPLLLSPFPFPVRAMGM